MIIGPELLFIVPLGAKSGCQEQRLHKNKIWTRRSEKRKKLKMILPIVRKVVYIDTKQGSGLKKSNLGHFPMRKWQTKWLLRLYKWEKLFGLWGSWYSNRGVRTHGSNAKIGFEKYAPSPKILPKKCPKSALQTKPAKFDTFWISRDSVHIFQNRFLRWNRELKPVGLSIMNPLIGKLFLTLKRGSWNF